MRNELNHGAAVCAIAVACMTASTGARPPAASVQSAPPVSTSSIVVEKPAYISIPLEILVNRAAAEVWKRVGKYCDVSEWLQIPAGCTILSGREGEVGAVRSVGSEVIVAKTEFSYTYTQPVRAGRPYNLYHGTLD